MENKMLVLASIVVILLIFNIWLFFFSAKPTFCYKEINLCVYGNWNESKSAFLNASHIHVIIENDAVESERNKYIANASATIGLWIGSILGKEGFSPKAVASMIDYCDVAHELNGSKKYYLYVYNGTTYSNPIPTNSCPLKPYYIWLSYPNQPANEIRFTDDGVIIKAKDPQHLYAVALILRREFR